MDSEPIEMTPEEIADFYSKRREADSEEKAEPTINKEQGLAETIRTS